MTKKEIIELYLADLNNLVPNSDAKRSRIIDLEDELEALLIHDIAEQKQHLIDMMRGDEELGLYEDSTRYAHNNFNMHETNNYQALKQGYEAGATEMSNKMYTEKDLRDAYNYGMFAVTSGRNFNDWFKNFKKK